MDGWHRLDHVRRQWVHVANQTRRASGGLPFNGRFNVEAGDEAHAINFLLRYPRQESFHGVFSISEGTLKLRLLSNSQAAPKNAEDGDAGYLLILDRVSRPPQKNNLARNTSLDDLRSGRLFPGRSQTASPPFPSCSSRPSW